MQAAGRRQIEASRDGRLLIACSRSLAIDYFRDRLIGRQTSDTRDLLAKIPCEPEMTSIGDLSIRY